MFSLGITDHLEGPLHQPSAEVYEAVADLVYLADSLGVRYAWFAEHHAHAHYGHMPAPLLFALHLAGRTHRIQLGTAIVCLNLHHPLAVAENVAVADVLSGGRMATGFGSGSTPEESALFGMQEATESERHIRFEQSLKMILATWAGASAAPQSADRADQHRRSLPAPSGNLPGRCWLAVNSVGAARIAGALNFNVLFSHLRTPEQYRQYTAIYRGAGGAGLIAANRPVFVGESDEAAFAVAKPALQILWRRFRGEGKIAASSSEPDSIADLCAHPINFIVGGPASVQRQLRELHAQSPFDVLNAEIRWAALSHESVRSNLQRLADVISSMT